MSGLLGGAYNTTFLGHYDLKRGAGLGAGPVTFNYLDGGGGAQIYGFGDPLGILKISGVNYIDDIVLESDFHIYDGNFNTGKITVNSGCVIDNGNYQACQILNSGTISGGVFSGSRIDTFGDMTEGTIIDGSLTIYSGANVGVVTGLGVELSGLCIVNNSGNIRYLQGNRTTGASQLHNSGSIEYIFADENLTVSNEVPVLFSPPSIINNGRFESLVLNCYHATIKNGVFKGGIINSGYILNCYANSGINKSSIQGGVFTGEWIMTSDEPSNIPKVENAYFANNLTVFAGTVHDTIIRNTLTIYDSGNHPRVYYKAHYPYPDILPGLDLTPVRYLPDPIIYYTGRNAAINVIAQDCNVLGDVYLRDSCIRGTLTVSSGDLVQNNVVLGAMILLPSGQMRRPHERSALQRLPSQGLTPLFTTDVYEYIEEPPNLFFGNVTVGTGAVLARGTLIKGIAGGAIINHGSVTNGMTILSHNGVTSDGPLFEARMPTEALAGIF